MHSPRTAALRRRLPNFSPAAHGTLERAAEDHQPAVPGGADSAGWLEGASQQYQAAYLASLSSAAGASGLQANPSATDPYHHVNLNGEATLRPEHSLAAGQSAASRHTHVPLGSITFHATPSHLAPVNTSTKPRTQQAHASQAVSGSGAASPFSYNQPQQLAPQLAPQPQYRLGESAHGRGHQRQPSASSAEPGCYSPLSRSISHTSTVTSASTTSTDAYARQNVPPGLPPVQVPMLDCSEYEDVVHNVVWEVGRAYGFQAFNLQPDTGGYKRKQYVPATIFVASDHLVNLLVRNMMLRVGGGAAAKAKEIAMEGAAGGDAAAAATVDGGSQQVGGNGSKPLETRFALAVLELHSHIFASYEGQWCDKVHLPARPEKYTAVLSREYCHPAVVQGLLAELAVYFLLYSEGVNMRHMPEGLWFFYWLMVHSPEMERFWAETETTEALPSGSGTVPTAVPPPSQGTRDKRVAMRNLLQAEIAAAQASLRHDPSAPTVRPTACAALLAGLPGSLPTGRLRGAEASMYLDLVAYGDGGFFCDRVVTPVFYVLSFEMDHMFQAGQEEAFRLGYDDCNESLCCRPIVKAALSDLGVTKAAIKAGEAHGGFTALTRLGCAGYVLGAECGGCESLVADVWEDSAVTAANGGEEGSEGAAGVAPGGASAFDAQRAALWWSQRVFVKTYKERRTFLAVYRTFYRVFSFHFTLMHILAAYAWSPMNLKLLSTAVITHSIFSALERYANWYMTRARPDPLFNIHNKSGWVDGHEGDDKKAAAKKRKGSGGSGDAEVGSGAGFSGLGDREAMAERHKRRQAFREEEAPLWGVFGWIEWVIVAIALTAFFVLQYIGPMTEMAKAYWLYAAGGYTAMVLGHGVITTRDGYCVSLSSALRLPSYFRAHSARPSATYWLARDMKIGWGAWWLTVLFWVQTLALKIVFDYFIIVKPMKGPIEMILQRDWLPCKTDYYQVMGTKLPIPCFDGDWVLVVIRVVPFILVMLVDSQIFYQITTVMWGIMRGLLRLDLGTVSDWASLRAEFHRGPMRWWSKCMSSAGNRNNRAAIALRRAGVPIGADFRSVSADLPIIGTAPSGASSAGLALDPAATGSSEIGPDGNPLVSGPAGTYSHIAQSLAGLYPQITVTAKAVSGSGDAEGDDDHAEGDDVDVEDADGADGADSKKGKKDKRAKDKKGGSKDKKRASGGKATGDNAGKRGLADMRMMLLGTSDESLAMWDAFATAWDEVVADLRSADLVSDKEHDYLVFTRLNYSPGLRATGVRPLLLPAFFYAGQVQRVVDTGLASSSQALVLAELRSLLVWLGCTLGLLNPTSAQVILEAAWSREVVDLNHSQARDKGLKGAVKLLEAMQEVAACVNTPQDAARRRAAHKDAVAAIADILRFLEVEARAVIHFAKKRGGSAAKRRRAAAADKKAKAKRSDDGCGGADGVDGHEEGEEGAFDMATHAPGEPLPPPKDDIEASERLLHVVAQLREALVYDPAGTAAALSNLHARADGGETSSQASAATGATNATQQWGSTLGPSASVASGLTTMTCMTGASGVAGQRGKSVVAKVIGVAHRMLTLSGAGCQPRGAEAQRILSFFMTSLANRQLEKPPSVDEMLSWTVLTPVYEEDVLYPLDARQVAQQLGLPTANASKAMVDLLTETEDSVSLMAYLRSVFPKDWDNFKERLGQQLNRDLREVTELDFAQGGSLHAHALALQLWASYRGQLLARTVRGMMCYERALRVLVQLEYPRPPGVDEKSYVAWVDKLVSSKFSYVVSVQVYGRCRNAKDLRSRWLAESVDILLGTFPKLKAAFLDSAPTSAGPAGFSVLIRGRLGQGAEWDSPELAACHPRVEEVYRVRLPANRYSGRNVIVGEGKPENQNHAVIFAHGEGLQTIDMNQDNALAEALKMRNLLGELRPDTSVSRASRRAATKLEDTAAAAAADPSAVPGAEFKKRLAAARATERPTALVGFREWIFSDVSGALGSFAACAEYTFGTLVQRTMSQPAHVRLHYGHPDLFNKVYTMTKGGVSKATRQLHISEDVFGGLNHNLRGGRVKYKEYISVGKGRDMGLDSINAFEIKISGGCGEIFLSRDMYRMASRLDFFRLLHLYFSAAGHYINNWLVMSSVYAQILSLCIFAFAQASTIVKPEYFPTSEDDPAPPLVKSYVFQDTIQLEYVLQLGMLSLIPFVAELALEYGFVKAVLTMVTHIVTGSFAFFVFKQQTTGFYFLDSLIYGGAQYIGTGRGFSITSSSFVKLFTNYGRSHLYLGFELAFLAIVFAIANDCVDCSYAGLTWGTWLAAVSLVFSPFWFNPLTFSTSKIKRDLRAFSRWLNGEVDPDTNVTWHAWNTKQLAKVRNDRGTQTDHYMNVFWGLITQCAPLALLALATVSRLTLKVDLAPAPFGSSYVVFLLATIIIWAVMWLVLSSAARFRNAADRRGWRLFSFWGIAVGITFVVVYLAVLTRYYEGSGIINLLLILYANLNILLAVHRAAAHLATRSPRSRAFVDAGYKAMDLGIGYIVLGIMGLLSLIGIVARVQTTLLFNVTFARSVRRGSIVRTIGGRKADGASAQLTSLMDDNSSVRSSPGTPVLTSNRGANGGGGGGRRRGGSGAQQQALGGAAAAGRGAALAGISGSVARV